MRTRVSTDVMVILLSGEAGGSVVIYGASVALFAQDPPRPTSRSPCQIFHRPNNIFQLIYSPQLYSREVKDISVHRKNVTPLLQL